jgi:hypothetical protein
MSGKTLRLHGNSSFRSLMLENENKQDKENYEDANAIKVEQN